MPESASFLGRLRCPDQMGYRVCVYTQPIDQALDLPDFALSDDDLRRSPDMKWRDCPADVIPAWIADLDVRPAQAVKRALHQAVEAGETGYPSRTSRELPEA